MAFWVNATVVWWGFPATVLASWLLGGNSFLASYLNWGFAVVNGIGGHILPLIVFSVLEGRFAYNPGVAQSLIMVPLGVFIILRRFYPSFLLACIINGILGHVVFAAIGANLIIRFGLPDFVHFFFCIVCSFVQPLVLAQVLSQRGWATMRSECHGGYTRA
eukprot:TRINITY_DN92408_c0_g1_i1.p1 TRINITY_DN92408_c0_g1~~TRINITY_DN92408_c0_g1_i1.p1  ORF type:complete len:176 (-),score=3.41 TRINITY_DN92408_c0_g1_i1:265-747(-)